MKVNILEAHDRLQTLHSQSDYISQGCKECIDNRPDEFKNHAFYIFAHKRELELDERIGMFNKDLQHSISIPSYVRKYIRLENVPTARLIWEPRLTKPKAQTNSMLFKSYPPSDRIKVIWILPPREMWSQYVKGNVAEHEIVCESIHDFQNNREKLEVKESDDLDDTKINQIYSEMSINAQNRKNKPKLML